MTHPTRIAICGRSLLLTLVADSLAGRPGLEVAYVTPGQLDALTQLAGCDLVIMEHADNCETDHLILSLLQSRPDLPIIGLDASRSVLTVLASRQQPASNMDDLVRLIEGVVGGIVKSDGETGRQG
jgi:CheY-like chemotaxis protein